MTQQITFRQAIPTDAEQLSTLIFASGEQEFAYLFGAPKADCIRFLTHASRARMGRFSYRRHWVVQANGAALSQQPNTHDIVAALAAHSSATTLPDNLAFAWMAVQCFGLLRTFGIIKRGLVLEHELPPPTRGHILLAHCATRDGHRGRGHFSALFRTALPHILPAGHTLVLDVLESNADAARLYARLGFIASARTQKKTRGLPARLASLRMRYQPNG